MSAEMFVTAIKMRIENVFLPLAPLRGSVPNSKATKISCRWHERSNTAKLNWLEQESICWL